MARVPRHRHRQLPRHIAQGIQSDLRGKPQVNSGAGAYIESDSLSGPYGQINLRYSYSLDERTRFGFGVSLARSEPQENHFRYLEGRVSADISRNFSNHGNIGLFGSFTTRGYDDFFPATNLVRQDETVIFGASYSPRSFEIYGSRPRLSCQNEQNSSNIALYEYETTDCGITFERSF
ncbi:surface lipoprotein assembly modifier [Octadecabacter arcticus]|uniref:surface lipoprotein assembly modifier n=1 Tax=Octadecabacter arcticus TaxID=53946 RepID=UPI000A026D5A